MQARIPLRLPGLGLPIPKLPPSSVMLRLFAAILICVPSLAAAEERPACKDGAMPFPVT